MITMTIKIDKEEIVEEVLSSLDNSEQSHGLTRKRVEAIAAPIFGKTPEGVPDNAEYVPPGEEPPEDANVIESPMGATYITEEEVDTDDSQDSDNLPSESDIEVVDNDEYVERDVSFDELSQGDELVISNYKDEYERVEIVERDGSELIVDNPELGYNEVYSESMIDEKAEGLIQESDSESSQDEEDQERDTGDAQEGDSPPADIEVSEDKKYIERDVSFEEVSVGDQIVLDRGYDEYARGEIVEQEEDGVMLDKPDDMFNRRYTEEMINDEAMGEIVESDSESSQDEDDQVSEEIQEIVSEVENRHENDKSITDFVDEYGIEDTVKAYKEYDELIDDQDVSEKFANDLETEESVEGFDSDYNSVTFKSDFDQEAWNKFEEEYGSETAEKVEHVGGVWAGFDTDQFGDDMPIDDWGPNHPDTAPLWQVAAEITGNDNVANEQLLEEDVSQDEIEAVEEYMEFTQDLLREVHGDSVTVTRGLRGEVADELRRAKENGESFSVNHRPAESWTPHAGMATEATSWEGGSGVVIEKELPIEDVLMASHTGGLKDFDREYIAAEEGPTEYDEESILDPENPVEFIKTLRDEDDNKEAAVFKMIEIDEDEFGWNWMQSIRPDPEAFSEDAPEIV